MLEFSYLQPHLMQSKYNPARSDYIHVSAVGSGVVFLSMRYWQMRNALVTSGTPANAFTGRK